MVDNFLNFAAYLPPFLLVLTVLVFIHELGHYLVARWNGVKIEVFSIGFGPEIFGWTDKANTRWKFSLIPLGGYVKMYGDADASSKPDEAAKSTMTLEERALTLQGKTVAQRIAVVAAGPIANYLLAIVLLAAFYTFKGAPTFLPTIGGISESSVAQSIGLLPGDKVLTFNGQHISNFDELRHLIPATAGQEINLTVERKKSPEEVGSEISLKGQMVKDGQPTASLGIVPSGEQTYKKYGILESITASVSRCYVISRETLKGIGQMLVGKRSSEELGGLFTIASLAKQSADQGWVALILLTAALSINLGLINLLPIPVLDGGHIVFYSIEAIRGKPVSVKAQEFAYMIGLFIVLGLMLISNWNDLNRLKVIDWLVGLFK
ncbi:RIP metalloprotease RseP [Candidatus Odyssella thessalonicensis]|nr:RIP metalloprotease RseP [Candidatus Odyssella thessalonicensis]